jgi:hypothetical protein
LAKVAYTFKTIYSLVYLEQTLPSGITYNVSEKSSIREAEKSTFQSIPKQNGVDEIKIRSNDCKYPGWTA